MGEKAAARSGAWILAVGNGLSLAWWRLNHELCFAAIHGAARSADAPTASPIVLQSVSCVCSFLGILVACLGAYALCRRAGRNRPLKLAAPLVLVAAQCALTLAIDTGGAGGGVVFVAFTQLASGAFGLVVVFVALSCYRNLELTRIARLFFVTIVVYGTAGLLARMPDFLAPGLVPVAHPLRLAFHLAVLAGASLCCLGVLSGKFPDQRLALGPSALRDGLPRGTVTPPPLALFLISYSLVFGVCHALASGIAVSANQMTLFAYLGLFAAGGAFYLLFRHEGRTRKIWPSVRQVIFPLAMLSFILLPFSKAQLALASIALAECAANAYFAFLFFAALVAARKLKASPTVVIARVGFVVTPSLAVGAAVGSYLDTLMPSDAQLSCLFVAMAFLLLVAGTFWVGDDRRAALLWGLEKRLTPRRFESALVSERCDKVADRFGLTKRERELLPLIAQGQTNAMIAEAAFISPNTVRTHVTRIHRKTGTHSRHELVRLIESL